MFCIQGRRKDIDLTGKTFNELLVIGPSDVRIHGHPTWECLCSCGKTCYCQTNELTSGLRKSCGHLRGFSRALDLTNKQFSDLSVLYKVGSKNGRVYWHCKCTCGAECDVITSDLTKGKRKDCGHSHKEFLHQKRTKDITGETYGFLQVIEMLPSVVNGKKWRAMCRAKCLLCGNEVVVQRDYLISGDTKSCGCLKSNGEQTILNYLLKHNINHERQYSFKDLKTPKGGTCWFDFGILNDDGDLLFLIEYQGKQHYQEMPGRWNFGAYAREITDPLKREYCRQHGIALHEIKYDSNIEQTLDEIFAS